jgi:hypothetical protein
MVFEARGDHKQAAHHYRQAAEFAERYPDCFEASMVAWFRERADKLDPPQSG